MIVLLTEQILQQLTNEGIQKSWLGFFWLPPTGDLPHHLALLSHFKQNVLLKMDGIN